MPMSSFSAVFILPPRHLGCKMIQLRELWTRSVLPMIARAELEGQGRERQSRQSSGSNRLLVPAPANDRQRTRVHLMELEIRRSGATGLSLVLRDSFSFLPLGPLWTYYRNRMDGN